ncbi:hypothetical protein Sme01_43290 [Sphaerisporangium melleum]|uniref:GDYXXLXY domain-containing protein n=1 Tax=Sphaerisporangium melleum TaxID=321316 RepID=A0A917QY04_9ACTN|nr:GDYXXLXY domain-containing protein [Sphaerisporangium melleum]GGK77428.1 hypothetical protein GCM10007964_20250 [Sphaerisporangium melleum]GII71853.1 hypothetical protein Sme01_43290 [Sphaerisporangium melleum]
MTEPPTPAASGRGRRSPARRALLLVAAAVLVQLALLAIVLRPQLSARIGGADYRLATAPVDPVDPFRGAYVMLGYPGLPTAKDLPPGEVFVPLVRDGALWKGASIEPRRPAAPPYLACWTSGYGTLSCGIDSLFLPEDRARQVERELRANRAAAVLKIDDQGNAAVVNVVPR